MGETGERQEGGGRTGYVEGGTSRDGGERDTVEQRRPRVRTPDLLSTSQEKRRVSSESCKNGVGGNPVSGNPRAGKYDTRGGGGGGGTERGTSDFWSRG